jgi:hypothetical protein
MSFTNVCNKLECLCLASSSNLFLRLWASPGAYIRVEHLKVASLEQAPALLKNIRLDMKGMLGANTLAYYEHL